MSKRRGQRSWNSISHLALAHQFTPSSKFRIKVPPDWAWWQQRFWLVLNQVGSSWDCHYFSFTTSNSRSKNKQYWKLGRSRLLRDGFLSQSFRTWNFQATSQADEGSGSKELVVPRWWEVVCRITLNVCLTVEARLVQRCIIWTDDQTYIMVKISRNLTVYRFPLTASVIRIPFDKGSPDLTEIWTLVSRNLPWHISIATTSSPSVAATPQAQKLGFADLLHLQKRVWTFAHDKQWLL